jgi:hypothetical protein
MGSQHERRSPRVHRPRHKLSGQPNLNTNMLDAKTGPSIKRSILIDKKPATIPSTGPIQEIQQTNSKHSVGSRVLCYHGRYLYEAKILAIRHGEDACFRVHYSGWTERHDEWVPPSRLVTRNSDGLELARSLRGIDQSVEPDVFVLPQTKKPPKILAHELGPINNASENILDTTMSQTAKKFRVPSSLRTFLAADNDRVVVLGSLYPLSSTSSVVSVIDTFRSSRVKSHGADRLLNAFCSGLIAHFDSVIGRRLLYRAERAQYVKFRNDYYTCKSTGMQTPPSAVYNIPHLVRMIFDVSEKFSDDAFLKAKCDPLAIEIFEKYMGLLTDFLQLHLLIS